MFEPIREIITSSPAAVVDDSVVLGEQAFQLFGGRDEPQFVARGGALYASIALANTGVLGPSSDPDTEDDEDGADASGRVEGGPGRRKPARRTTTSSFGSSSSSVWYERGRSRRRAPGMPAAWLAHLVSSLFYLPFRVVVWGLTVVAYVLPWLRVVFPFAVPASESPTVAAPRGRSGPERVVAIAFHPNLPLLAAAVAEGGPSGRARIALYDVTHEKFLCALTHAFQRDVESLAWKPCAKDVLLVGCSGGVLVWHLTAAESPAEGQSRQRVGTGTGAARPTLSADVDIDKTAQCLFYNCARHVPVTAMGLSCVDGRYVACASRRSTYLHVIDLCVSPASAVSLVSHRVVTVDGGLHAVRFAEDDSFLIAAVHAHAALALVRFGSETDSSTVHVGTPAPVTQLEPATGIPHMHYYVLTMQGLEGAVIARVTPFAGVEVVATLSTSLFRGVGGGVRCMAASHSRLLLCVETGHVVVCRYGFRDTKVTLMPVGVAALEATELCSFPGFTQGSLFAAVEREEVLCFVPCYHT